MIQTIINIENYKLHLDQENSVTYLFDIIAELDETSWSVVRAIMTDAAPWFRDDAAEKTSMEPADRTIYFAKWLREHPDANELFQDACWSQAERNREKECVQ